MMSAVGRWVKRSPTPVFVVGLLLAWEVVVRTGGISRTTLPSPVQVGRDISSRLDFYWQHAQVTLEGIVAGLGVAMLLAAVLALVIAEVPIVGRALYPLLIASQAIPAVAIAPLLVMNLGYGMRPKIFIVTLICFFPMTISISRGLVDVDRDAVRLMRSLGAGRASILWRYRIPNAMPYIFTGLKISVVLATIGAVVSEWVGSLEGLGYLILTASDQLSAELTFGAITVTCALGLLLYGATLVLERLAMPWK